MAETAVVEPVVTAPVTTVVETPVVNPPATPEPDLLTRVSQFKSTVVQDKIENPPDQPEFAAITDPVAKKAAAEAVERMRRGLQSDYTKKLEDAQRLVNQSKSWTPQRIQQELLTNPEFVVAAQMINGQQAAQPELTQEQYSALTDAEKAKLATVTKLETELNNMKQQTANDQIRTAITQKDLTLRGKFSDFDSKAIDQACVELGKLNLADVREYVYKATNFENSVKNAYEMGKLEGQGKLQTKINVITPQGTTVTNNEGVPTKQAGENDKSFFVRLGQFRLNQFKTQK
jgi:hypothetical protein